MTKKIEYIPKIKEIRKFKNRKNVDRFTPFIYDLTNLN